MRALRSRVPGYGLFLCSGALWPMQPVGIFDEERSRREEGSTDPAVCS